MALIWTGMSRCSTLATTTGAGGRCPAPPPAATCCLFVHPDTRRTAARGNNKIDNRIRLTACHITLDSRRFETYMNSILTGGTGFRQSDLIPGGQQPEGTIKSTIAFA